MAVIKVWERWQGRGATTDEKGVQTLKRQWGVQADHDLTNESTVVAKVIEHDSTAALFQPHPAWPFSICRQITVAPFDGPKQWLVDASYSSAPFQASGGGGSAAGATEGAGGESPSPSQSSQQKPADQRPPVITVTRKEVTEPLEKDVVSGAPIVNTVGDPFNPPVEVFRSHHLITWKFFRTPSQLNWTLRSKFLDSVNSDAVSVFGRLYPAYSLRCTDYAPETVWEAGAAGQQLFFSLTVQAEFNPRTWKVQPLNAGRRGKETSIGPVQVFVDGAGQPVADPVPLQINGTKVAAGSGVYDAGPPVTNATGYYYLSFDGYTPKVWTGVSGIIF